MSPTNNVTTDHYGSSNHNGLQDDIRDYVHVLEKASGKDKYICPICNGNDLSLGANGFTCYTGNCEPSEIYKVVKRLAGHWLEHSRSDRSFKPQTKAQRKPNKTSLSKPNFKPAPIEEYSTQLAQLPSIPLDIPLANEPNWIPPWLREKLTKLGTLDTLKVVTYRYSKNTWLDRYEWDDKSQEKGTNKTFFWGYRNPETGEIKGEKLEKVNPYRFNEVLKYAEGKCFLAVEGEKCIEACRSISLVASDIAQLSTDEQSLLSLKERDLTVIILPDKDKAGIDKANKLELACKEHQVKYLILDTYSLWKDKPNKYDIADAISEPDMNAEEIIEVLNYQIEETLAQRVKNESVDNTTSDPDVTQHINQESKQASSLPVRKLNIRELIAFLRKEYNDSLRFNLRQQRIELNDLPVSLSKMRLELAEKHHIDCRKSDLKEVIQDIAIENQYDPVKTWLEEIRDKAIREQIKPVTIDNLSTRYFGTSDRLYDIYFKKFLISTVARVFDPGCKVDTMLVLQGKQGCGKSTFFQVLAKDWYGNSMSIAAKKGNTADELATAQMSFINEYAELENIVSSKSVAEFKELITRQVDTYRKPYAEAPIEHPRNYITVGTTNEEEFLKDPTGNRRFWGIPIAVKQIDTSRLEEELEGIWATAIDAYFSGQAWHLSQIEEEAREKLNSIFQLSDEWENLISDYLEQLDFFVFTSKTHLHQDLMNRSYYSFITYSLHGNNRLSEQFLSNVWVLVF